MTINVFIDCNPPKSTHQASLRIMKTHDGRQFVGKQANSKGTAVAAMLAAMFMGHRPATALVGPLAVHLTIVWPWRASETKAMRASGRRWAGVRPDADNLAKLFLDVLTRLGFWTDDAQVASLQIDKQWGDRPGIGLMAQELEAHLEQN